LYKENSYSLLHKENSYRRKGLLGVHHNLGVDVVRDLFDQRQGHFFDDFGLQGREGPEDLGRTAGY
jgi:hypothetical protein